MSRAPPVAPNHPLAPTARADPRSASAVTPSAATPVGVAVLPVDAEVLQQRGRRAAPGARSASTRPPHPARARRRRGGARPGRTACRPAGSPGPTTSGWPRTPSLRIASRPTLAASLSTASRSPPIRPNMRKTFSTGSGDAVGREHPEAGEVRLVLELERPRHGPLEVDAVLLGQGVLAGEGGGGVAGVERRRCGSRSAGRRGQAAQPSGSLSPMMIGLPFSSG